MRCLSTGFEVALKWLWGGFVLRSLCLVYAYYMALRWLWVALPRLSILDVGRSMSDVPDREPSRFAAGRNGLGCRTFWRLLALVAAANWDGSRSGPELDAALPRWVPSRKTLGFSASRHKLSPNRWPLNLNRSSTRKSSASRCGPSACRSARV